MMDTFKTIFAILFSAGVIYFWVWIIQEDAKSLDELTVKCNRAKCQVGFHSQVIHADSGRYCDCLPNLGE